MRPERRDLTPAGIARRLSYTLREQDREAAHRAARAAFIPHLTKETDQ